LGKCVGYMVSAREGSLVPQHSSEL
jgi:hypothetical protein